MANSLPLQNLPPRGKMVTLFCAVDSAGGSPFPVDIDAAKTVGHLKKAIKEQSDGLIRAEDPWTKLQLFLAMAEDGTWLKSKDLLRMQRGEIPDEVDSRFMKKELDDATDKICETFATIPDGTIHVLVVVPSAELAAAPGQKRPRTEAEVTTPEVITPVDRETMSTIASNLNIDTWTVGGGVELDINRVEPDFPEWFYVRKETLDLIKLFHSIVHQGLSTVFVGTPGIGKSMLVVMLAFYMALKQKKRVVLFRQLKQGGFSMLYLDPEHHEYWRKHTKSIADLDLVGSADFELCLDGFQQKYIKDLNNFGRLSNFRMLATSGQYDWKNDETLIRRKCLVPFWSMADITAVGIRSGWTDLDIKERYFYSGGNLRAFLSGKKLTKAGIDEAVGNVGPYAAEVLKTQYGRGSVDQVDRLRMMTVLAATGSMDPTNLDKYWSPGEWTAVVTSEYALRSLGKIVKPSYYEELWSTARMLGDDGLMGIAFENYVHTIARSGETIELQVRPYDRVKTNAHNYVAGQLQASSCLNEGRNVTECRAIMRHLTNVDYWYPLDRCLGTIDSVAKLSMGEEQNVTALIQITKSGTHSIASGVLNDYAEQVSGAARYVALVPDEETSNKFRLNPVSPPTEVPLYVAYLKGWVS